MKTLAIAPLTSLSRKKQKVIFEILMISSVFNRLMKELRGMEYDPGLLLSKEIMPWRRSAMFPAKLSSLFPKNYLEGKAMDGKMVYALNGPIFLTRMTLTIVVAIRCEASKVRWGGGLRRLLITLNKNLSAITNIALT